MPMRTIGVDGSVSWTIVRECPECKGTGHASKVGSAPSTGNCAKCIKGVQRFAFTKEELLAFGTTAELLAEIDARVGRRAFAPEPGPSPF